MKQQIAHYNTWIEISESAYANNIKLFRKLVGKKTELSTVVKANAYGHGWEVIVPLAIQHGADSFCVHSLEEALKMRNAGCQQEILIMGHVPLACLEMVVQESFRLAIFNRETLLYLKAVTAALDAKVRVHLKLETGTHRQGISEPELPWFLDTIQANPLIVLEAAYTHFANIEDTTTHEYAAAQKECFQKMIEQIQAAGYPALKRHNACTAAALLFPETHHDIIRLGIGQYGCWPSRETLVSYREKNGHTIEQALQPVLTWKTRVTQIKWVNNGNTIGYGRTYKTTRDTRIAVLPIGYSDGYHRRLSNQGYVLIQGRRAPVRGRICMNLTMVDITDIPDVQLEDEVVLIGRQGNEQITVDDLAGLCGSIHYEIMAQINRDIPRLVVRQQRR